MKTDNIEERVPESLSAFPDVIRVNVGDLATSEIAYRGSDPEEVVSVTAKSNDTDIAQVFPGGFLIKVGYRQAVTILGIRKGTTIVRLETDEPNSVSVEILVTVNDPENL